MNVPIRFGIPSLDDLLIPRREADESGERAQEGTGVGAGDVSTNKLCILGPDGTGKSILALHLASRYAADTGGTAKVVFVSTDMQFARAKALWDGFMLDDPNNRGIPFERPEEHRRRLASRIRVDLAPLIPASDPKLSEFLLENCPAATSKVGFLDLAAHTAGDDWAYATRILKLATPAQAADHRFLMVLDSIAGFETLVGETDAFGQGSTRRSRIAQIIRAASDSWHLVFIVEDSLPGEHRPEEFITDCVLRLRRLAAGGYSRLTLEVEKSRSKGHAQGQHPFEIRDGRGGSTGNWQNADDPVARPVNVVQDRESNAYVQVFPSLHQINRRIMRATGVLPEVYAPSDRFCGFGIPYLDNLLARPSAHLEARSRLHGGESQGGLAAGSVTALVGDDGTHKSMLGRYFLQGCFQSYARRFASLVRSFRGGMHSGPLDGELSDILKTLGFGDGELRDAPPSTPSKLSAFVDRVKELSRKDDYFWWLYRTAMIAVKAAQCEPFHAKEKLRAVTTALEAWERAGASVISDPCCYQRNLARMSAAARKHLAGMLFNSPGGSAAFLEACRTSFPDEVQVSAEESPSRWKRTSLPRTRVRYGDDWFNFAVPFPVPRKSSSGPSPEWERAVEVANWILRHPRFVEPAILITTRDERAGVLGREFAKRLLHEAFIQLQSELRLSDADVEWAEEECARNMAGHIVCRRLAIHDAPSALLIHVLEKSLDEALQLSFGAGADVIDRPYLTFERAWQTRVVVDDLRVLANTYPDVKNDSLFLPYVIFRLQRRGVTSLLLGTYAGRPSEATPADPVDAELRALTGHQIHTWKVSFYGQNRIAITVIPALASGVSGVVRELKQEERNGLPSLLVDPRFELYSGIEEGSPVAVPLQVQIFTETRAFRDYIAEEEGFWRQQFLPVAGPSGATSVLTGIDAQELNYVRELCHLPRDEGRPYTLIFPVDMYWALKDSGALMSRKSYLTEPVPSDGSLPKDKPSENFVDPFGLFRDTRSTQASAGEPKADKCRLDYFRNIPSSASRGKVQGYICPIRKDDERIDRIPFMWDFGFLLCRQEAWAAAKPMKLRQYSEARRMPTTVGHVWSALMARSPLPASSRHLRRTDCLGWRPFFEACREVANARALKTCKPAVAFDLAAISPDSISCLFLEIWASEIYSSLQRNRRRLERLLKGVTCQEGVTFESEGLTEWLSETIDGKPYSLGKIYAQFVADYRAHSKRKTRGQPPSLKLEGFSLELYKTWLLLVEVLDLESFVNAHDNLQFKLDREPQESAIAARHWYKTASMIDSNILAERGAEFQVPARLPGHFSTRGDWFLAAARGSRSERLADLAMDLLSSRRANFSRLQRGLGLPTRDLLDDRTAEAIRTPILIRKDPAETATYGGILRMAASDRTAQEDHFYWLWRSRMKCYDRQTRVWQKWLNRLLQWTIGYRYTHRKTWVGGFGAYDQLSSHGPVRFEAVTSYDSFVEFAKLCDILLSELKQASPPAG